MIVKLFGFLFLMLLLLINSVSSSYAEENLCHKQNLGWHFYCDPRKEAASDNQQAYNPIEELESIQKELEYKKALAVLKPTEENIASYKEFQSVQVDKASYFADQYERVNWKRPDLDYTLKRPINTIGKRTWMDERNKEIKQTVENINQRYGIFFFFRSDCPYCHKYSPIIKNFAIKNNINVMAISMDGGVLEDWPDALIDNGQSVKLDLADKPVPATIMFDKETNTVIPLGYGLMSEEEIINRMYALTELEVGNDY
jgi:conjugal transfer pilus assembly protein TraF